MDQSAKVKFVEQLAEFIRTRHGSAVVKLPQHDLPVTGIAASYLESLILGGIERAGAYHITWQSALAAFVVTMFVVAPNFDEDVQVRVLLKDRDIEPDYRMDTVQERVTEDRWNLIRQRYNSKAWAVPLNG